MKLHEPILRGMSINRAKYKYIIGIDCGVKTGYCVWSRFDKRIRQIATLKIHEAMESVRTWHNTNPGAVLVRVEDARQRSWFGKAGRDQLQGAGSIKRDSKIWDDFLEDLGVDYEMVKPAKNATKWDAVKFRTHTGYTGITSEHSRDAAMLVYDM